MVKALASLFVLRSDGSVLFGHITEACVFRASASVGAFLIAQKENERNRKELNLWKFIKKCI